MRSAWLLAILAACSIWSGCRGEGTPPQRPVKFVDLSPPLTGDTVRKQFGRKACEFFGLKLRSDFSPVRPPEEQRTFGFTYFEFLSHGGAHLDAAARLLRDGNRPAEVPLDKLYGWARVLDLRWHDRTSPISITDLQNYKIKENEIILLYVGYTGAEGDDWPQYAYLSPQAAHWLAATGIRAIGMDTPSLGSLSEMAALMEKNTAPDEVWASHVAFFSKDIPVIEGLVNLDQLLGQPRAYFAGFPLPLSERSGAPVRAVGMIFE